MRQIEAGFCAVGSEQTPAWTGKRSRRFFGTSGRRASGQQPLDTRRSEPWASPIIAVQQAEEAALRPPRARIVLRDRQRRDRRHTDDYFQVVLTNQPGEEGTW